MTKPPAEETADIQRKLADTLRRTADVLDQSAQLAEADAERGARQHDAELEAIETERAQRARTAARQARLNAERLDT
jgi:hypothetical protein